MAGHLYLENAARCLAEARNLPNGFLKRGLIEMADMWLQLTEETKIPHARLSVIHSHLGPASASAPRVSASPA